MKILDHARHTLLIVDHAAEDFERYRSGLARSAAARGLRVVVALPDAAGTAAHGGEFDIHPFHLARLSTSPADDLRTLAALIRLYRRTRPRIVHHFGVKPALYGGLAARVAGVAAVVSTFTGLGYLFQQGGHRPSRITRGVAIAGLRHGLRSPSRYVVCQIEEDRRTLLRNGIGAPERARLIEGLGVDLERFRPVPEPPGPPVVVLAGRLLASKGVHDFVFAAEALRRRGVHARFVLLGEPDAGHPSAIPTASLERWNRSGAIEWHGWAHDIPRWLAQSHVICLPTSYGEGIPRVLMEGAAAGRSVVASDLPGCRAVVSHGETGLLVRAGDRQQLAEALATLIENPSLRARMGAAGRQRAERLFDQHRMIARYIALYEECLLRDGVLGAPA